MRYETQTRLSERTGQDAAHCVWSRRDRCRQKNACHGGNECAGKFPAISVVSSSRSNYFQGPKSSTAAGKFEETETKGAVGKLSARGKLPATFVISSSRGNYSKIPNSSAIEGESKRRGRKCHR